MRHYVDIATHVSDVTPFMQHSDYLLMACGLNAVAQAYHYATPLVVLPDDRPHQEQEMMAQALIAQGRALSWKQFKHSISAEDILANPDTPSSSQQNLVNHLSSAQMFMDSTTNYAITKPWFNEWLLPKLALKPDA
jgi:predicted glycosyltransferase